MLLNQLTHMFEDPQPLFLIPTPGLFCQMRRRIQAKARYAKLEPEEDDVVDLFKHRRRGQIQIRLMAIEHMPVVLSGFLVP